MYNKPGCWDATQRHLSKVQGPFRAALSVPSSVLKKKSLIEMIAISLFGSMRVGSQSFGDVSTPRLRTNMPLPDPNVPAFSLNSNDGNDKSQNAGEI
jgi:hypothetical protein